MEKIGIACFTQRGASLADRLEQELAGTYEVLRYERDLKQWCASCFERAGALLFIGACGIAVRTIAPFLRSKTTDPAVLVLDEAGRFVISLLSGHLGGANELAIRIARQIGAVPVITTASDVNGLMAVDVFAKRNHLQIDSMESAKKLAAALLRKERVGLYCSGAVDGVWPDELTPADTSDEGGKFDRLIWISERRMQEEERVRYLKDRDSTVLHLIPRTVVLGIGCRKGKTQEEIDAVVQQVLDNGKIPMKAVSLAASIDLKKEEPGMLDFCRQRQLPYQTYQAEELQTVPGVFSASEFVRKTAGVENVCERAALLAAGPGGRLIQKKYAENGVTAALAVQEWRICFDE